MNRYAPELALVAGALLGIVFGGFVLFSVGEFYSAAIVCALFGYPFAAYAIHSDAEPTPPAETVGGDVLDPMNASSRAAEPPPDPDDGRARDRDDGDRGPDGDGDHCPDDGETRDR